MIPAFATDFTSWRNSSRTLLERNVAPEHVHWDTQHQNDLFSTKPSAGTATSQHKVSKHFIELAKTVACFRDDKKWSLLYRTLWRLKHNEPYLLSITTDNDIYELNRMAKAVRRDSHKMKAFVRFREHNGHYIAWHEPSHLITERTAPFFARRFSTMRFAILTPDKCAYWDTQTLSFSDGLTRDQAPKGDELEELWKTFYRNIFNPARIKINMMKSEMPVKYWHTMPETELIKDMLAEAPKRIQKMIDNMPKK